MADVTRLKRYTTLASAIDMLVNSHLPLLDPSKWSDTNDTHFLGAYLDCSKSKSLYAACFTQAQETYHHWQVFAGSNEGVCIDFDREALLGSLRGKHGYMVGNIKYRTLDNLKKRKQISVEELPFLKRFGFSDEREFRVVYCSTKPQHGVYHIPIERNWIKKITLNPWLNNSLFDSIRVAINSLPNCSEVKVHQTTLINNSAWKNACEKVTELQMVRSPVRKKALQET